jgi:diacylglycerol kinase
MTDRPRPLRHWRDKFREAFRGVWLGIRGHTSFRAHFACAALALAAGAVLRCAVWEWCAIIGCIGLVLTAELFNSALETLFHGLDDAAKARITGCLDIAAGAVLMACLTAVAVGGLIVANHLLGGGG